MTGDPRGNPNAEKQKRNRTPSSVCKCSSTRCKVISQTYNASFTYIYTIKVCDPKIQMKKIKNKIHKLWHVYILSVVNMYFTHLSGFVTYPIVSTEQYHLRMVTSERAPCFYGGRRDVFTYKQAAMLTRKGSHNAVRH